MSSVSLASSTFQQRLQNAFHTEEFDSVVADSPAEAEEALRLMLIGVERQIADHAAESPEWAERAKGYKRVLLYHLRIAKLAAKTRRREDHLLVVAETTREWKDVLLDLYDLVLEKLGDDNEAANWVTPMGRRSLHEWYLRETANPSSRTGLDTPESD